MRLLPGVLVLSLLLGSTCSTLGQEKSKSSGSKSSASSSKSDSSKDGKARGVLPANYRQLGLSDEQRQNIYKIQNDYSDRIDELQKKIDEMKLERNAKYLKVLTKAQRERLEEIKKGDKDDKSK